jgi:pilus assembly protein Flp/PilA
LEEVDVNGWVNSMQQALLRMRSVLARQEGQGMTEYGLILVLIAVAVILMLGFLGHQVNNAYSNISNGLGG